MSIFICRTNSLRPVTCMIYVHTDLIIINNRTQDQYMRRHFKHLLDNNTSYSVFRTDNARICDVVLYLHCEKLQLKLIPGDTMN